MSKESRAYVSQILLNALKNDAANFKEFCKNNDITDEEKDMMKDMRLMGIGAVVDEIANEVAKADRGFELVSNHEVFGDVKLPERSTAFSAGYDFFAPKDFVIGGGEVRGVQSGVKAYMRPDEVLKIYPRSSMGIKKNVILANTVGVIDADFYNNEDNEGNICLCLYNYGKSPVVIHKGDKVAQGVFQKFLVGDDVPTELRKGGIGSTGK